MARGLVLTSDGVEEIEALTIIDVLRRAGVEAICGREKIGELKETMVVRD